jgi:ATP-binding cassette subfamily B protein
MSKKIMDDLIRNMPQYINEKLQLYDIKNDEVLLVVKGDLNSEDTYGESWVISTANRLIIITGTSETNDNKATSHKFINRYESKNEFLKEDSSYIYPFDSIENLLCEGAVASGMLIATIDGQDKILCRYTNSCARDFGQFTRLFTKLKAGKSLEDHDFKEDDIPLYCPKCGTRYDDPIRKICPKCFDKRAIFMRVTAYLPKYKMQIALMLFCMLTSSILNILIPYLTGNIFFDRVLKAGNSTYGKIGLFVAIMFFIKLLTTVISIWYGRINSVLSAKVIFDLKTQIFEALQKLSLSFYSSKQTGTLMNNVNWDAQHLQYFFHDGAPYFIVNLITMIGILGVMLSMNWQLALLALFPIPIIVYVLKKLFPKLWTLYSRMFRRNGILNSIINDSLNGSRVVKAFGKEGEEVSRFSKVNKGVYQVNVDVANVQNTAFPLLYFFMGSSSLVIWGYGSLLVVNGHLSFGSLITFTGYMGMLLGPLQFMTRITNWWSDCMNSASRIFEIMDAVPEVEEKMNAERVLNIKGEVELQGVTFGYEPNNPVLHDITLHVQPGEMIGIVGHSGAGKSTLTNIITRLYDVKEGRITIDGLSIKDINLKDLHSHIGIVLQETFLFMGTIAENIAYACPNATMEEIIEAAKMANAHDFIMKFPDGYDTIIGSRGQNLSGGEKQRISIARAVLMNPKILILDEATASLDTETERLIQEALNRLVKGRTTFSIAHRLSTLRNADRLVVIEKGKIEECGTHEELMKKKGIYHNLLQKQKEALKLQGVN